MNQEQHIVAKSVHSANNSKPLTKREIWARIAYYYPQYTLKEVSELPLRDIRLLLHTATKIENERMYNLTQIAAAPHTKKGKGVKDLTSHFSKQMK